MTLIPDKPIRAIEAGSRSTAGFGLALGSGGEYAPLRDLMKDREAEMLERVFDGEATDDEVAQAGALREHDPEAAEHWRRLAESRRAVKDSVAGETDRIDVEEAWRQVRSQLHAETAPEGPRGTVVPFPGWATGAVAAAAVIVLGMLLWPVISSPTAPDGAAYTGDANAVSFVETEIPDASTIVYVDEVSGWSVVWVTPPDGESL